MKNLKKLREERHLSQKNFAEKFNLSQQSIHKYENNQAEPEHKDTDKNGFFFPYLRWLSDWKYWKS